MLGPRHFFSAGGGGAELAIGCKEVEKYFTSANPQPKCAPNRESEQKLQRLSRGPPEKSFGGTPQGHQTRYRGNLRSMSLARGISEVYVISGGANLWVDVSAAVN